MPFCPDCGVAVGIEQSFCIECGADLGGSAEGDEGVGAPEPGADATGSAASPGSAPPNREGRDPPTTEPGSARPAPGDPPTALGVAQNVAGALAYVLGIVSGIFLYVTEPENRFVRFHAAQSIVFSVGIIGLYVVVGIVQTTVATLFLGRPGVVVLIPAVVGLVSFVIWVVVLLLWLFLMVKAFNGETYELPVVGEIAAKYV